MEINVEEFLQTGFDLRKHLSSFLGLGVEDLNRKLPKAADNLALLHPGNFKADDSDDFYENKVGEAHLLDLASWHLGSSDYIADTLRLQNMFAKGKVLDFGGGIGTHALASAAMQNVDHVYFVDLNPENREFVHQRAFKLGLDKSLTVHRDLDSVNGICFDTIVCLDVLEHLSNPSDQILQFHERANTNSVCLFNWYFFKGWNGEYPFHFDEESLKDNFFYTLQKQYREIFHPFLITTRAYKPIK